MLNRIEMAFRAYDPCLSCATHSLPGSMPLVVEVRDVEGRIVQTVRRDDACRVDGAGPMLRKASGAEEESGS